MARFDPEAATVVAAETLLDQALGSSDDKHQASFCCALTTQGPRIYTVHLPACYSSALDGRVTQWDNKIYAFLGDVTQDIATTICFPANAFTTIANMVAHTEEYILANLQMLNGLEESCPRGKSSQ
jgi:hypothetical protein